MRLVCDPCEKDHAHDRCARTVRAFIEPDGPDTYSCECYCNRRRILRQDDDRNVRSVLDAYEKRHGADALTSLIEARRG